MGQISTKPVSGMRDFLPAEARRRRETFRKIESVFNRYGFDPIDTPCMENLSTLLGKYGEEGDQLIFKVLKRGNKLDQALSDHPTETSIADFGLRYDLTVPLARIYAQYQNEFPRIFKRYQIAPVWRADRPQKGRFREFMQCDVDIIGTSSLLAEVEVISALSDVLAELKFDRFTIHINHRALLFATIAAAGISEEKSFETIIALDKFDKVGTEGVKKELEKIGLAEEKSDKLLNILTKEEVSSSNNEAMLSHLKEMMGSDQVALEAIDGLSEILSMTEATGASGHIAIDPFLARGLSYYTGAIFEIRSSDFAGSIGGGGRYDKLIGMFRGNDVPAVGFSLGIERILMLLEERETNEETSSLAPDILITLWDKEYAQQAISIAAKFRKAGMSTDIYCNEDKLGKQLSYANERKIPFTVIMGPEEVASNVIKIKEMESGQEHRVGIDEACELIRKLRQ